MPSRSPSTPETAAQKTQRARDVNKGLARQHPDARCELDFDNSLQLLVATVLSAQCTDERVNQVTPRLFARYQSPQDYATATRADLEEILRSLGFQRAKAGHLIGIGEKLVGEFGSEVPRSIAELTSLPGVGRKTALVVRGNAFGEPGLAVDTHVQRLSRRLDLSQATTPAAMEKELAQLIPEEEWTMFSHRMIFHGRRVCRARTPECGRCSVASLCPSCQAAGADK